MRLPSMPPMAAPASVPTARLPAAPPTALPISAPAPAPTSVPPTSFGPESAAQAASAAPITAIISTRTMDLRIIAVPSPRVANRAAFYRGHRLAARRPARPDLRVRQRLGQNSDRPRHSAGAAQTQAYSGKFT